MRRPECAPTPPYHLGPFEDGLAVEADFAGERIDFPARQGFVVSITAIGYWLRRPNPPQPHRLKLYFGRNVAGTEYRYVLADGDVETFFTVFPDGERGLVLPCFGGNASAPYFLAIETDSGDEDDFPRDLRVSWRYLPASNLVPDGYPNAGQCL